MDSIKPETTVTTIFNGLAVIEPVVLKAIVNDFANINN